MKRMRMNYIWMGMVGVCLLMSSCKKNNENKTEGIVFKATIEQAPGTRTNIDPQGTTGFVNWSAGDKIQINNGQTSSTFTLASTPGTNSGDFTTTDENFYETGNYVAVYPQTATIGDNGIGVTLANTQTIDLTSNTFAEGINPMVATSTNNELNFKNVCGGICIPLKGWGNVTSIVLTSKNTSEKLWGDFTITDYSTANPVMTYTGNTGNNVLTLSCGSVVLSHNEATDFYIVLPQGVLAGGFKAEVMDGNTVIKTIETTSAAATVERNTIKKIGEVTVPPTGSTRFTFSVSPTQKVYFSHGNLQYQACSGTWQFAGNQYDYVGNNPGNNTEDEAVRATQCEWIDLFGWGTSGMAGYTNHPVNWQPWTAARGNTDYYAYGDVTKSLFDDSGLADWGKNPVLNGGNDADYYEWRTPSMSEWYYVLKGRVNGTTENPAYQIPAMTPVLPSDAVMFAMANVAGVNGMIVLPDEWVTSTYTFVNPNDELSSYSLNTITEATWNSVFEPNGAVFMPAAGDRVGPRVETQERMGDYWSSTTGNVDNATQVYFCPDEVEPQQNFLLYSNREKGRSVRFVIDAD